MKSIEFKSSINVRKVREDFPILSRKINNHPLIYFDNAATSQTPQQVIDVISDYYSLYNANIHRGVHHLSQEATDKYEASRKKIQNHFNAKHSHEVIFTSGATHSINIVAHGFTEILKKGLNNCNFSEKVFDGEDVYILKLVDANLTRNEHKLCTLYYQTVSGHKIKREKKLNNIKINIFYPIHNRDISNIYFETKVNNIPMKMISTTK